jgi:hypothetical protein
MQVRVVRYADNKSNPNDYTHYEFEGELVNKYSEQIAEPKIGKPIYIKSSSDLESWDFCTGVVDSCIDMGHYWGVVCHGSNKYVVFKKLDEAH